MKRCYVCNKEKETRPFGEHGQDMCFECMKASPESEKMASNNLDALLTATSIISPSGIVTIDGEDIRPTRPDDIASDTQRG